MKNCISFFFGLIFFTHISFAQYSGVKISAGIVSIANENKIFTQEGTAHYGYHFGIDARLNEGFIFLNPGFHYYKISLIPTGNIAFFSQEFSMTVIKGRMDLGFIIDASRLFKPRFKFGGTLNFISDVTEPNPLNTGQDEINNTFGLNAGIGADISIFTIDLDYERGMTDGLKEVKNSKFHYLTFSLGFFF